MSLLRLPASGLLGKPVSVTNTTACWKGSVVAHVRCARTLGESESSRSYWNIIWCPLSSELAHLGSDAHVKATILMQSKFRGNKARGMVRRYATAS